MSAPDSPDPDIPAIVTLPAQDRLGVLSATADVVRATRLVRLDHGALDGLAARWARDPWPEQAGLDALHFTDGTPRTANWVLLLDALNFCFWPDVGAPRWRVEWRGDSYDGYAALAAALTHAVEQGRPLWDATYLAQIDDDDLRDILRYPPEAAEIPLFEARLANVREVGRVLCATYGAQFTNAIESVSGSAVALAWLLAREFPSFHDVTHWRGQPIPFLKRAQICVADLNAAFGGVSWGAFTDLDQLTAFADYKLPQLLRRAGALVYAPELAARVDAYAPIAAGSEEEIAIRAATVWAVELLRRALAERDIQRTPAAIDYRLWAESQAKAPDERPYHRTRTMYY
ncbi:MAG TPA: queuosine salvage family protein [Ktedonobacterales bacterium]|nr:queuosine salvage family protein [Ktedonobacterales bacterium]